MTAQPDDLATKQAEPLPLDQIRRNLTRILRDNNVGTGPGVRALTVSVNNPRERQELLALQGHLRADGTARAGDWLLLGDGLSAAGCFREASDALSRAAELARAEGDAAKVAEAEFKRFRAACELGNWDVALAAYRQAVRLAPEDYELFDSQRYEIVAILGAGGFGAVFHCLDTLSRNEVVAVKALYELDAARDPAEVFAEAHTLKELAHPGIIGIKHWAYADRARRRPYLVLEYFPGQSLEAHLRQHGSLSVPDALAIGRLVAQAMQAAHESKVLHRDLKPGNILVRKTATGWDVRVVDFGLAVPLVAVRVSLAVPSAQRSLRDNALAGTLRYAPPEQSGERTEALGPYSDVYSFGKTIIEALLGLTAPVGEDWKTLPVKFREQLRELLEKCIHTIPARRHPGFAPILAGLDAIDPVRKAQPAPVRPPQPARPGPSRREVLLGVGVLVLAGGVTGAVYLARHFLHPTDPGPYRFSTFPAIPRPGELVALTTPNGFQMQFAWIPPGSFTMGSELEPNEKAHPVTLTRGFYMGIHEVTQAQWQAVMGTIPSYFKGDDKRPVENVSWDMATEFRGKLRKLCGEAIRLPSEAEWEYACRAGTTTRYHGGDGEAALKKVGWYDGNGGTTTHPVGQLRANAWGLYDMHGNVCEWCQDWYGDSPSGAVTDPLGASGGLRRVLRGGSWYGDAASCRSAYRTSRASAYRDCANGFRLAVSVRPSGT